MDKIDNFEKLEVALEAAGYDYDTVLNKENIEALQKIILSWGESDLKNANRVLHDYYAMKVPSPMLKEILSKNIKLANEVYTNGIGDTSQREVLSYAVMSHIGVRDWPSNGEGRKAMQDFVAELKEKSKPFGIEFVIDIEKSV